METISGRPGGVLICLIKQNYKSIIYTSSGVILRSGVNMINPSNHRMYTFRYHPDAFADIIWFLRQLCSEFTVLRL